jgi:hypothetical protein
LTGSILVAVRIHIPLAAFAGFDQPSYRSAARHPSQCRCRNRSGYNESVEWLGLRRRPRDVDANHRSLDQWIEDFRR